MTQAEAHSDSLRREPASVADLHVASSGRRLGEDALSWASMFERHLKMLPCEATLGRKMPLSTSWQSLTEWLRSGGSTWEEGASVAWPDVLRRACHDLGIEFEFPEDFDRTLVEMRARRNVLVHRGGMADARYCAVVGRPDLLGQRRDVTEEYLDRADRFVTDLAGLISRPPRR